MPASAMKKKQQQPHWLSYRHYTN